MGQVASFHLVSARPWDAPVVLARLATDRRLLGAADGLVFSRLLGTGRGSGTGPSIRVVSRTKAPSVLLAVMES